MCLKDTVFSKICITKNKILVCKNEKYLPTIHWSVSSVMAGPNGSLMGVTKFSPLFTIYIRTIKL